MVSRSISTYSVVSVEVSFSSFYLISRPLEEALVNAVSVYGCR